MVKAATLAKLCEWLVAPSRGPEDTFDYHFFLTLHTFTTPSEVLTQFEALLSADQQNESRIFACLYKWMRKRPTDFLDPKVAEHVARFAELSLDLKVCCLCVVLLISPPRWRPGCHSSTIEESRCEAV